MNPTRNIALTCDLEDSHHGLGVSPEPSSFERDVWELHFIEDEHPDAYKQIPRSLAYLSKLKL